ncbi:MAG: PKD domain-containing protein [Flavobacteriales bacterium]|nr:PKD domain-containing protein [Flavobacteriales bacterium]
MVAYIKGWIAPVVLCVLLMSTVISVKVQAQTKPPSTCENLDFSRRDFTGWVGRTTVYKSDHPDANNCPQAGRPNVNCPDGTGPACNGACYSVPGFQFPLPNACFACLNPPMNQPGDFYNTIGIFPGRHTIITNSQPDPFTCNNVMTLPPGENQCVRLGNGGRGPWGTGVGWEIDYLSYSFVVGTDNQLLTYKYAVVLQDPLRDPNNPPHSDSIRPRFNVFITNDLTGELIDPTCGAFEVIYDTTLTGFRECSYNQVTSFGGNPLSSVGTAYRAWTTVGVDLRSYVGVPITITFNTWDCGWGGHFGYAYVTARCDSLGLTVQNCTPGGTVTISAPEGFAYDWFNGESTRTILVDNVSPGDSVWVTLTSRNGCKTDLGAIISPTQTNAIFTAQPSPICEGDTVFFDESSYSIFLGNGDTVDIQTYQWDFGDSGTDNVQDPYHIYTTAGTYEPTLIVYTDEGCLDTAKAIIQVDPMPVADFVAPIVCAGAETEFTDNSVIGTGTITSYSWNFGHNNATSTSQNPTYTYPGPGTYTVTLDVSSQTGCPATVTKTVEVVPAPVADISGYDVCLGDTVYFTNNSYPTNPNDPLVGWTWSFGDKTSFQNAPNPAHIYQSTGTFDVKLTVVTQAGCTDDTIIKVNVYPPPVANFSTGPVCVGSATNFTDLSSSTGVLSNCVWDFGDGTVVNGCGDQDHIYGSAGVYTVKLFVAEASGCSDSIVQSVMVNPEPIICFTDSLKGCVPLIVDFADCSSYGGSCLWDFGDGSAASTDCQPTHQFTEPGCYDISLTVTSPSGCKKSLTKPCYVEGYPWPNAAFDADPIKVSIINPVINFTDKSTAGVKWNWFFGDGDTAAIQHPNHTYREVGEYNVVLAMENQYGCKDTVYKKVIVEPISSIYVPNVFSPNGDGVNDFFKIEYEGFCEVEMFIFDRWGNEIFQTSSFEGWNGKANGGDKIAQEDVYVWLIRAIDCSGERWRRVGQVTLVR